MNTLRLGVVLVTAVAAAAQTTAQTIVEYVVLDKGYESQQVGPSSTVALPLPYKFEAIIVGYKLSPTAPSPTELTLPTGSSGTFNFQPKDVTLRYEGNTRTLTAAELSALFPNGPYHVQVGSASATVNFSGGDRYPNQPVATINTGTWHDGKLYLTPEQAAAGFTITSNVYEGWTDDGTCRIAIAGQGLQFFTNGDTVSSPTYSLTVAGGKLQVGRIYGFMIKFDSLVDFKDLTGLTGPDAWIAAIYSSSTYIEVHVIPEPAHSIALAGACALLGAMALAARRRTV